LLAMAVGQATMMVTDSPSSPASRLLHVRARRAAFRHDTKPVGASLLAMAVGQATMMVADSPSSPASRLLQIRARRAVFCHDTKPVGASLLAMAVGQATMMVADSPSSPASRLLQGIGGYQVNTAPTAKVSVSSFCALVWWPLISNWLYSATSFRLSLTSWNSAMPRVS